MSTASNPRVGRFLGQPLPPEERRRVLDDLFVFRRDGQRAYMNRMAVPIFVSTVIAACGLMADSAAVVIGAMLVAPLMRPVMAAAAAISLGWTRRLYTSLGLVLVLGVWGDQVVFQFRRPTYHGADERSHLLRLTRREAPPQPEAAGHSARVCSR